MLGSPATSSRAKRLASYVRGGMHHVAGWLSRIDGEIFMSILLDQQDRGVPGSAMEIGVHHGRSFIPLSLASTPSDPAIAIDIFENQRHNAIDPSGKGDFRIFSKNLKRFGLPDAVQVISSSSLELSPSSLGRSVRFASVDGGHWHAAVLNDLRLVASCAGPDCIIALDDMFNPDYAEVMAACFDWLSNEPQFKPFAISSGKIYFCRPGDEAKYKAVLLRNSYILFNHKKSLSLYGSEVVVITGLYSGTFSPIKRLLKIKSPVLYENLKRWMKSGASLRDLSALRLRVG